VVNCGKQSRMTRGGMLAPQGPIVVVDNTPGGGGNSSRVVGSRGGNSCGRDSEGRKQRDGIAKAVKRHARHEKQVRHARSGATAQARGRGLPSSRFAHSLGTRCPSIDPQRRIV
jgi:hypothetical protein